MSRGNEEVAPISAPPGPMVIAEEEKQEPFLTESQKQILAEVQPGLNDGSGGTVGWDSAVDVMRICNMHVQADEVQEFIEAYLHKIVGILLDQQVGKIGHHERRCVELSLEEATGTLDQLFRLGRHEYIPTITAVLDKKKNLYKGDKSYWSSLPGAPEIRQNLIARLARQGFFHHVGAALQRWERQQDMGTAQDGSQPEAGGQEGPVLVWQNAKTARILLLAVQELRDDPMQEQIIETMCVAFMKQLSEMSEEKLKKETTNDINDLIQQLRQALADTKLSTSAFEFGMNLTLKYLKSTSLPMRLFGLEQLPELIELAAQARPPPRSYVVEGAGCDLVNGEYKYAGDGNAPPKYCRNLPDGTTLTLFRCTMRSRAKWWFISEADKISPGTDKDIDYYQHKSQADEEYEPPESGWLTCTSAGASGIDPPPTLRRVGLLCEPGEEENTLEHKLLTWLIEHKVLDECFGPGIHREVVARSQGTLRFLNRMGTLNAEHLDLVWNTAIGKGEAELQDEIYVLLANMATLVKEDLLVHLLETVQGTVGEAFSEAVDLTEKLSCKDNLHYLASRRPQTCASILKLLWSLLLKPEITKEKACDAITNFFLNTLRYSDGDSYQKDFLSQCLDIIKLSVNSNNEVEEEGLMRALKLFHFLLESLSPDAVETELEEFCMKQDLSRLLFQELAAYKARLSMDSSRHSRVSVNSVDYEASLNLRLDLIRQVHSISRRVILTQEHLSELWELLADSPMERELALQFLNLAGTRGMNTAMTKDQCIYVFQHLICDPKLDWSELGDRAYQCFNTYFQALCVTNHHSAEITLAGLETLWRAALSARKENVPFNSAKTLLRTYRTSSSSPRPLCFGSKDPQTDLLDRVFKYLSQAEEDLSAPVHSSSTETAELCAERCLLLLKEAVGNVAAQWDCGGGLPHGVRGTGFKLSLLVQARRMGRPLPNSPGAYQSRTQIENLEPFTVDVHPLDTVGSLKARIGAVYEHPAHLTRVMYNSKQLNPDDQTVAKTGLQDGDKLNVFYVAKSSHNMQMHTDSSQTSLASSRRSSRQLKSLGDTIASEDKHFKVLFDLLERCARLSDQGSRQVAKAVWDVLLLLPTQVQCLESVSLAALSVVTEDSIDVAVPLQGWDQLLPSSNWHKAVYTLQIIDAMLQPAPALADLDWARSSVAFRRGFIESHGFLRVLNLFMQTPVDSSNQSAMGNAVALRIVKFCLFGPSKDNGGERPSTSRSVNTLASADEEEEESTSEESMLRSQMLGSVNMGSLLEKLLETALSAVQKHTGDAAYSQMILDALLTVQLVLEDGESMIEALIENGAHLIEGLVTTLLVRSQFKTVRKQAGRLITSNWDLEKAACPYMFAAVASVDPSSSTSKQLFSTLAHVVAQKKSLNADVRHLGNMLAQKLMSLPRSTESTAVLNGCLSLMKTLMRSQNGCAIFEGTALGEDTIQILNRIFNIFLFMVPSEADSTARSLCVESDSRRYAFEVLLELAKNSEKDFGELLGLIEGFNGKVAPGLRYKWGYECSFDAKPASTTYVGLKNQGCTCYMNSLLQQLFMHPALRETVLEAKVKKTWQVNMDSKELVGQTIIIEWETGHNLEALVTGYNEETKMHTVKYSGDEDAILNLKEGRQGKETGVFRLADLNNEEEQDENDKRKEKEMESAMRVLEQVQRTFMYLQSSERRYFDPRPLVEACKCLNLNYNVYQQNDASEFCDKLLDRIETALKGQTQEKQLQQIFGGKMVYQKIPKDCDHRTNREDPFVRVECIIRGKDNIEDSLATLVEGELMEGDNKVECEDCGTKKDTVRRTCFGTLPNCLILHLKRFDLDYNTFETVKLNNRCAFPPRLNLKPYTKEGIEEKEAAELDKGDDGTEMKDEGEVDDSDYEYDLKGVLVHAGIAQGGHYYSFIRDPDGDKWHRFDDEDVTPWDVSNLESATYGGTATRTSTFQGVTNTIEQERLANGLLLFYDKIKPRKDEDKNEEESDKDKMDEDNEEETKSSQKLQKTTGTTDPEPEMVDGVTAFGPEVREANVTYICHSYVFDSELHSLLRGIIETTVSSEGDEELSHPFIEQSFKMGISFLLDILLHSRERVGIKEWSDLVRQVVTSSPNACRWFLMNLTGAGGVPHSDWLSEYLLECPDLLARNFVVKFIAYAVGCIADSEEAMLKEATQSSYGHNGPPSDLLDQSLVIRLIHLVTQLSADVFSHARNADELFLLIGELAAVNDTIRRYMVSLEMIARLANFVLKDRSPKEVSDAFPEIAPYGYLHQSPDFLHVLEAIATLLGAKQVKKAPLLEESSSFYQQAALTKEARAALTTIFKEQCRPHLLPLGMEMQDIMKYMEQCNHNTQNITTFYLKSMLQKYDTLPDGRLSQEGFLQYYRDTAAINPKQVWQDLYQFQFRSDLRRGPPEMSSSAAGILFDERDHVALPHLSEQALGMYSFYEHCFEQVEGTAQAILVCACQDNQLVSQMLIQDCLDELSHVAPGWQGQQAAETVNTIISHLMSLKDKYSDKRLEILFEGDFGLFNAAAERVKHAQQYPNDYQHVYRLINLLKTVHGVKSAREWLDQRPSQWDWMQQWVRRGNFSHDPTAMGYRNVTRGGLQMDDSGDDSDYSLPEAVKVQNAGTKLVNGIYKRFSEVDGTAAYQYIPKTGDQEQKALTLYRCKMNNGAHQWYISIVPEGRDPGTNYDVDFYLAMSAGHGNIPESPPMQGWQTVPRNSESVAPAPTITHLTTGNWETESEGDLNVNVGSPMNNSTTALNSGSDSEHTSLNSSPNGPHDTSMDSATDENQLAFI